MAWALVSGNGKHEMTGCMRRGVPWSARNEACSQGQRVRDRENGGPCVRKTNETRSQPEVQRGSIIAHRLHASCLAVDVEADELREPVAPVDSCGTDGEER